MKVDVWVSLFLIVMISLAFVFAVGTARESGIEAGLTQFLCVIGWIVCNTIVGCLFGKLRAQLPGGIILAVLFGPFGWLLTLALSDRRPRCQECRGVVIPGASRCVHCGNALAQIAAE